ncbi:Serine palmitoyltransferase [Operophtera brumata]|uniref:Serine palmitoyltransferase n=1 Tax=Operophtera brumata TaxID=104452 RepID=A0A0L7LM48_OPEBR|nr:Serine palmitoyltransferase [Operophtera brumata]
MTQPHPHTTTFVFEDGGVGLSNTMRNAGNIVNSHRRLGTQYTYLRLPIWTAFPFALFAYVSLIIHHDSVDSRVVAGEIDRVRRWRERSFVAGPVAAPRRHTLRSAARRGGARRCTSRSTRTNGISQPQPASPLLQRGGRQLLQHNGSYGLHKRRASDALMDWSAYDTFAGSFEPCSMLTAVLTHVGLYVLMLLGFVNQLLFKPKVATEKNREVLSNGETSRLELAKLIDLIMKGMCHW